MLHNLVEDIIPGYHYTKLFMQLIQKLPTILEYIASTPQKKITITIWENIFFFLLHSQIAVIH